MAVTGNIGANAIGTTNHHDVLEGTKIRFYRMSPEDDKRVVIYSIDANGNTLGTLYDSGYTSSTDLSYTMTNDGHISIYLYSRNGYTRETWISFENANY